MPYSFMPDCIEFEKKVESEFESDCFAEDEANRFEEEEPTVAEVDVDLDTAMETLN